jgi:toxin ParE1/3/4
LKRLELSAEADADLTEILSYGTERFGEAAADAYFFSFEKSFELLRRHPEAGQVDEQSRHHLRRFLHKSHRIFYRLGDDAVLIVRVFHHSRDVGRYLEQ